MSESPVIYGTVSDATPKKRRGPRPGWKNTHQVADVPTSPRPIDPAKCRGCELPISVITVELITEHVRAARDRASEAASPKGAETDLLYLAARLDGYCSLGCWRQSRA